MADTTGTWAERCASDAEARDWALQYGRGEFYYSPKWGELTAVADGTTTVTDVADALVRGDATAYEEALAAHYFAEAADYLLGVEQGRVADARAGHPDPGLADDNGDIPWLVDDDEVVDAEFNRDHVANLRSEAHELAREAGDREDDARRWAEAESEADYHEAGARSALESAVSDAWRKAVGVEYDQRCAEYGNDGRPEDDRHISAEDKAAQAVAVAEIAAQTGLAPGAVWDAVRGVTDDYALDHTDTKTLGQPDWDAVADRWAQMEAEVAAYREPLPSAERVAEQGMFWDELGEAHPAVREAFWSRRDDALLPADVDIDAAELDAAYTAAGEEIAAAAGLPAPPASGPGPDAYSPAALPAWDEEAHRAGWSDAQRAAADAVDALDDPAGWGATMTMAVPAWVAEQGGDAVAEYIAKVAAEASESVDSPEGPVQLADGTEVDPDEPLPVTVTASGEAVLAAEEAQARAYEAGDAVRQAQQRDADDETHESAVALQEAEAEQGVAAQEAEAAQAALAAEVESGKGEGSSTADLVAEAREAAAELADDDAADDGSVDVPAQGQPAVEQDADAVVAS